MLVIGRHEQEEIVITVPPSTEAREVVVTLVEIRSRIAARIGVATDREVTVDRREVHEAKKLGEQP